MNTLKKLLWLCASLALAASAQPKKLVLWHSYRAEEKVALEKIAAAYNKANAGKVEVTTLAVPYDAYADKITATVPAGKGPDIFIFAQDRLGGWVEAGKTIEPIDFYLDDATKGRFLPGMMEAMTYHGNVFGLPLNYKAVTLIYNKALVPTPPKTTGELVAMAKKLTDVSTGRFGLAYEYANFYFHSALMNGFGGRVFDAGTKPVINNPQNVKSVQLLMKWLDKDKILPKEPSGALITSLFNEGKAAMVFSGPWFLGEVKGIDYGLALLPAIDEAGGKPMRPWMTIEGVYVSASSANKDAAYDFAKYLTDTEPAKVMALEGRQSPTNKAVYSDPKAAADPVLKACRAQADQAVPMPNVPEMTMVWSPATTAMNAITKKTATPKAALDEAQKMLVKDVANLRKK